jgi:feruloyl-CoA hydratase/lyase
MGLVNDAVPSDQLRERTRRLAQTLLGKNPVVLRAAKQAYKQVRDMSMENAADYLSSKMDQTSFLDSSNGRAEGMKQFLDDKSFKPGLGTYKKS